MPGTNILSMMMTSEILSETQPSKAIRKIFVISHAQVALVAGSLFWVRRYSNSLAILSRGAEKGPLMGF